MPILEVKDLQAGYGKLQVLYGVSLRLSKGELVSIIGPNGSGKSTLLKSIFGLTTIYSGQVVFNGVDITQCPPHEKAKLGLAYLPQVGNVFYNLTVRENLVMAGYVLKKEAEDRVREVLEIFPKLKKYLDRKAYTLSGGERQMLAMAMALIRKPKVVMLDEPTANLAPKIATQVLAKIQELKEMDMGVLLVEQNVKRALEVSDYTYLLVAGRCAYEGKPHELISNPDFARLYLGY